MNDYVKEINNIISAISTDLVNLNLARKRGRAPTQAFSDFLTHSEQGDWAELVLYRALSNDNLDFIPVRYGKSDKIHAGDVGFKDFYETYQDELDAIGKRPDLLLFSKNDYDPSWGDDISGLRLEELHSIVPLAIAGLEVRSSAYLNKKFIPKSDRPELSFTPKVEDLNVVLKWIDTYGVPHFYVQVFFDSVYAISFKDILILLKNSKYEEKGLKNKKYIGKNGDDSLFVIEKNPKNQFKETVMIYLSSGTKLGDVSMPDPVAIRKELASGRLLHYSKFNGGNIELDINNLNGLINA